MKRDEEAIREHLIDKLSALRDKIGLLENPERFLLTIFNSIRDPFMILDRSYQIIMVNDAYAQMKSISISELIRKRCYEVVYSRDNVCDNCIVEKTFRSGDPCAKEKPTPLKDGSEIWVEIYTYPIFNEKGEVPYVIEYVRNITERKRMEKELERLATTDRLTQVYNRTRFEEVIDREIQEARRYNHPLSMIMLDIDHFKEVNDRHGHNTGDYVLKAIASIIRDKLREIDYIVRWGGEEFIIINPNTNARGAGLLAERLRKAIEGYRFEEVGRITVSFGVTQFRMDDTSDSFIKRADDAMYLAKQKGRNRTEVVI